MCSDVARTAERFREDCSEKRQIGFVRIVARTAERFREDCSEKRQLGSPKNVSRKSGHNWEGGPRWKVVSPSSGFFMPSLRGFVKILEKNMTQILH